MNINIELNSKEVHTLITDSKDPIEYKFNIDIYTESKKEISAKEETLIFAGIFWALCTMLPYTIIHALFKQWNDLVISLKEGLNKGDNVIINTHQIKNIDE